MKQLRPNDMMLQVSMRVITLIIFAFSFYLFFAGHNNPGGGFIGGLMTVGSILALYLAFDIKTISEAIPIHFTTLIGVGLLIAVLTGISSLLFDVPFLTHFSGHIQLPLFGEVELTTALPFDLGVYLVVVGASLTIILAIAEDDQ